MTVPKCEAAPRPASHIWSDGSVMVLKSSSPKQSRIRSPY